MRKLLVVFCAAMLLLNGCGASDIKTENEKQDPVQTESAVTDEDTPQNETDEEQTEENDDKDDKEDKEDVTEETTENSSIYTICGENSLTVNGVNVKYPVLSSNGGEDERLNSIIESEIKGFTEDKDDSLGKLEYEVKLLNDDMLSIIYSGYIFTEGAAYSPAIFFSTNVDLNKKERIRLTDYTAVDSVFVAAYKKALEENEIEEISSYILSNPDEEIIRVLNEADKEGAYSPAYSYYTKDGLGIAYEVPHVMGDYILVEIPYEELSV